MRSIFVCIVMFASAWGCGSGQEAVGSSSRLSKSTISPAPGGWTRLDVSLLRNGLPLHQNIELKLSRLIAGKSLEFVWSGLTDHQGRAIIDVTAAQNVTGYYYLAVDFVSDGKKQWTWSSIPLNDGFVQSIAFEDQRRFAPIPKRDLVLIEAAVFSWLIENDETHLFFDPGFYCLERGWRHSDGNEIRIPVEEAVFGLLPKTTIPVVSVTQCELSPKGVFDPITGARGVKFQVERLGWQPPNRAVVWGSSFRSSLDALWVDFTVEMVGGNWVVVQVQIIAAS